jgi:hypothetical protein
MTLKVIGILRHRYAECKIASNVFRRPLLKMALYGYVKDWRRRSEGVNGSQSKFLTETWSISQNQPDVPLSVGFVAQPINRSPLYFEAQTKKPSW